MTSPPPPAPPRNAWVERSKGLLAVIVAGTALQQVFHPTLVLWGVGVANGSVYGLLAIGIVLVYRVNRFINFAAAGLGAVPGVLAVELHRREHLPYLLSVLVMVFGGLLLGALVHVLVLRRFARAPRLVLTVVSIGLVQLLALLALVEQFLFRDEGKGLQLGVKLTTPFSSLVLRRASGAPLITGDELVTALSVAVLSVGLAVLLRKSRTGIAMRAVAENADRALMLAVPVERVQVVAWAIAGLFGSAAIFLRASVVGLPLDGSLGYGVLLYTLAAAVIAKMSSIPLALVGGIAVGLVEQAASFHTGSSSLATAIICGLLLVTLLVQRSALSRADDSGVATWRAAAEYRPVPAVLRRLPEVRLGRALLGLLVAGLALGAPALVTPGEVSKLALVVITAIIAVSLVVLTGWAGQVSLGQFGIVGMAAAVSGRLAADQHVDFFVALGAGIVAGTVAAVLVAVPAVRIPGLYLAVTTLALAAATEVYLLNPGTPVGRLLLPSATGPGVRRPLLLERIDLANDRTFYFFALAGLFVALSVAGAFRRSRSGRVLIAVRDNSRAAAAFSIDPVRTKVAAFAVAGGIASLGGVLLAYQQTQVSGPVFGVAPSIALFVAVVLGGSGSLAGGVGGAVLVSAVQLFVDPRLNGASLLVSGPGLIVVLAILPGGLAQGGFALRDRFLVRVARARGLLVPALDGLRGTGPASAEGGDPTLPVVALV